jgi:hypothetical protein
MTKTKIEKIWTEQESESTFSAGVILKRYSAESIPDAFVSLRLPEKSKGIAFRINNNPDFDISAFSGLRDINPELIPDEADKKKSLLVLSVNNNDLTEIFAVLAEDLFRTVSDIPHEAELLRILQERFIQWKNLFEEIKETGLSSEAQAGLYGELYFLKKLLTTNSEAYACVKLWVGPDKGIRDFEKNLWAVEVKTTKSHNQQKLHISSERQLDTTLIKNLYLMHLSVETRNGKVFTLNDIVQEIGELLIDSIMAQIAFRNKILIAGYFPQHIGKYSETSYLIRDEAYYVVTGDFPRIEEHELRSGVGDVKYSVVLSGHTDLYKTTLDEIINNLNP